MDVSGDDIADAVLKQFDKLPAKRKPQIRGDGVREWVPLSGIVAQGATTLEKEGCKLGTRLIFPPHFRQRQAFMSSTGVRSILPSPSYSFSSD